MVGGIIYEDEEFVLADFSDNFAIDMRLLLKNEHRTARIYAFVYDEKTAVVRLELSSRQWFQRINYTTFCSASDYINLRNELLKIKTPRDFTFKFIELISSQMAKAIRNPIRRSR